MIQRLLVTTASFVLETNPGQTRPGAPLKFYTAKMAYTETDTRFLCVNATTKATGFRYSPRPKGGTK